MRTMNFARFFKGYGEVDILYLKPESTISDDSSIFTKKYLIEPGISYSNNNRNNTHEWRIETKARIKRFIEKRPHMVAEWSHDSCKKFKSLVENEKYDVILCRYISNSLPLFQLPEKYKKKTIIDFDDFYSEEYLRKETENISNPYRKFKKYLQNKFLTDYQKKCLRFGAALFCSKIDLENISRHRKNGNIHIVPNTYPGNIRFDSTYSTGYCNLGIFLFIGTLDYGPNRIGIKWFVENIFQHVLIEKQDSRLLIVGRNPPEEIRQLCANMPQIELHSDVPDVGPFYEKCGVVIVPILNGGGTRIKILEAGMAQRPVLSTPFGAYGLDLTDGKNIMLFKDRESFMRKYKFLSDKDSYNNIASNLKNTVESNYSPESFINNMKIVINNMIGRNG